MKRISTKWKIMIASICVASAAILTGCEPSPVTDGDATAPGTETAPGDSGEDAPETGNNADQSGNIDIDVPGADIEIETDEKSDSVDIDVPRDKQSGNDDGGVNLPE